MKKRRINSINDITRTSKRTRKTRSFKDETVQLVLKKEPAPIKKYLPSKKKSSSDGLVRKPKKQSMSPSIENIPQPKNELLQKTGSHGVNIPLDILSYIRRHWFWLRYIVSIGIIILGIFLFFGAREKTVITLRPHHQYLTIDRNIIVHRNPLDNQLGFDIMAITDEVSLPIVATGTRDVRTKAAGTLTVYNDFSTEPQRLLPETRFESAGGKIFVLGTEAVIVPGRIDSEPGVIDVQVYADGFGPDYNVDITDFTIPGFKEAGLDTKYNGMYAVSTSRFEGGSIGSEKYITDSQRITAESELSNLLIDRLSQRLAVEKNDDLILINATRTINMLDSQYIINEEQGTEVLSKKGTILVLVVGESKLKKHIEYLFNDSSSDQSFIVKNINNTVVNAENISFDFEQGSTLPIRIAGSPLLKYNIDEKSIKNRLLGKSLGNIHLLLDSISEIDRAHIVVRPFWRNKISSNLEHIIINYE